MVAGDLLQYLGRCSIDGNLVGNDPGHFLLSFAVNQDGDQLVVGIEGPLNDAVSFGNEDTFHVAPAFTPHPQGMITKALEHLDSRVERVRDRDGVVKAGNEGLVIAT